MRLRSLIISALLVAAIVLSVSCGSGGSQVDSDSCPATGGSPYYPEPGTNGAPVGQQIPQMPHSHVAPPTTIQYNHNPPTSGCHYSLGQPSPAPVPPGFYKDHIDAEHWVHNLEHGYIVVVYNCPSGCQPMTDAIRQWMSTLAPDPALAQYLQQNPQAGIQPYSKVVAVPWSFDHQFAAVSWDWYDPIDATSPKQLTDELTRFYANHVGQSPEGIGAS